jgi:Serine hydrolase (FSH1)
LSLVFLDAPHILQPVDAPLEFGSLERSNIVESVVDPELVPRAWWRANEEKTVYQGVNETLVYVRDFLKKQVLEHGPFDVCDQLNL